MATDQMVVLVDSLPRMQLAGQEGDTFCVGRRNWWPVKFADFVQNIVPNLWFDFSKNCCVGS